MKHSQYHHRHHHHHRPQCWRRIRTRTIKPRNFTLSALLLMMMMMMSTTTVTTASSHEIIIEEDIDDDDEKATTTTNMMMEEEEEEDDDDNLLHPYSIPAIGVPQNFEVAAESSSQEEDDDGDDAASFSLEALQEKMEETEVYFQTRVLGVLKEEQVKRCRDHHELCTVWSLHGDCRATTYEAFMEQQCAASCRVCHQVLPDDSLCYYLDNGPDVWRKKDNGEEAGDLEAMFRRIVAELSNLQVLSSPESTTYTTDEGEVLPGPWIVAVDDFLTATECERLIELGAQEGYGRSALQKPEEVEESYRTSSTSWCSSDDCKNDLVAKEVLQRIFDMTGIPAEYSEDMQMLHYEPGQYYKVHSDYIQYSDEELHQAGSRILTVFLYLNEVEEGGATGFTELNLTVVPKAGRALIWPSVLDANPYKIDWSTEHEALKVIRGTKYGANVWFHLKPFGDAYTKYHCCERKKTYLENGPDAWEPGDLDLTFERVVNDPYFASQYNTQVLSAPAFFSSKSNKKEEIVSGPWVITMDNFLTSEEASRLIELGTIEGYARSLVNADGDEEEVDDSWRTSQTSWCKADCEDDPVVQAVLSRIYNVTQVGEEYAEIIQLLKYDVGQFYKVHRDYIDMDEETEEQEGNRIMTFYMYLNDVEEGGHTGFPDLGLKIAPKLGRVVMWPNVLNSEPDEASEMTNHESLPVIRGVKYGANLWFRQKPLATSDKRFTCDDDDYEDDEEGEKELDAIDDHASQVDNGDIEYREANTISNDEL